MNRFGNDSSDAFNLLPGTRRAHAEFAITRALQFFELGEPPLGRLSDLADAIDAFGQQSYCVAKVLAEAAVRDKPLDDYALRQGRLPTVEELGRAFKRLLKRETLPPTS